MSNKIIYHYTNNVQSILENKELWLTRSIQSNDAKDSRILSELIDKHNLNEYCLDCINVELTNAKFPRLSIPNNFDVMRAIKNNLNKINNTFLDNINNSKEKEYLNFFPVYIPFVTCFTSSDNRDSRLLFDAYTNNMGCSIGFKRDELTNTIHKHNAGNFHLIFQNIFYSDEDQLKEIRKMIKASIETFIRQTIDFSNQTKDISRISFSKVEELAPMTTASNSYKIARSKKIEGSLLAEYYNSILECIGKTLCMVTPFIKNEYWKEECEIRLTNFSSYKKIEPFFSLNQIKSVEILQMKSKYINYDKFDYIRMPIDLETINDIIIGPCVDNTDKKKIIELASTHNIKTSNSLGADVFVPRE